VDELRRLIAPQLLRRTKAEVAKDLPRKIEVAECRSLPISERQRAHYADAIGVFRRKPKEGGSGIQNHLGLLQYLRRLCSDPKPPGAVSTDSTALGEIIAHSPKMAWMLQKLEEIRVLGEKVIVFCEFRDLQRTLKRAISERFGLHPDIINGDTSAAASNSANRSGASRRSRKGRGLGSSSCPLWPWASGSTFRPPTTLSTSPAHGTLPRRIRRPTGPTESAKRGTFSFITRW
jgi:hypothetical protein